MNLFAHIKNYAYFCIRDIIDGPDCEIFNKRV